VFHKLIDGISQHVYCVKYMNAIDKAIELAGGLTELARKIGANPNQVGNWRSRGAPIDKCAAIENATQGKVTRRDLRPDDWQRIWPELADAPCSRRSTDKKQ
jgi:DNA-binding transcriptional regulator YdaS (Cro superfamily)